MQQQLQYNAARDSVPLSAAPELLEETLLGIYRRLGMEYVVAEPRAATVGAQEAEGGGGGGAAGAGRSAVQAARQGRSAVSAPGSEWNAEYGGQEDWEERRGSDDGASGADDVDAAEWDAMSRAPTVRSAATGRSHRTARSAAIARSVVDGRALQRHPPSAGARMNGARTGSAGGEGQEGAEAAEGARQGSKRPAAAPADTRWVRAPFLTTTIGATLLYTWGCRPLACRDRHSA